MEDKKVIRLASNNTPPIFNRQSILLIRTRDILRVETDFDDGIWWILAKEFKVKIKSVNEAHLESDIDAIIDHITGEDLSLYLRADSFYIHS